MKAFWIAAALALFGCEREAPRQVPPFLFDCRASYDAALAELKKAGGEASAILHPTSAADLSRALEPSKRYAYVVLPSGALAVSPKSEPSAFSHAVLASGGAVRAAGYVTLQKSGDALSKITVDGDSDAYCPTSNALESAVAALLAIKASADAIRIDNRPPACFFPRNAASASVSANAQEGFGEVMLGVARRFEILGRAHLGKRDELAAYELDELEESFRDVVPITPPPPLPAGASLSPFITSMTTLAIPGLRKALATKDDKAFDEAFAAMAKTCNACHAAAGRAFIEVPEKPGETVPRVAAK